MRNAFSATLLMISLSPVLAWAQAQSEATTNSKSAAKTELIHQESTLPTPSRPDSKIENIQHEDAGSRIDELRVGGVTKSITVQPKGGNMPPYDLSPENNRQGSSTGKRGWTVLGF